MTRWSITARVEQPACSILVCYTRRIACTTMNNSAFSHIHFFLIWASYTQCHALFLFINFSIHKFFTLQISSVTRIYLACTCLFHFQLEQFSYWCKLFLENEKDMGLNTLFCKKIIKWISFFFIKILLSGSVTFILRRTELFPRLQMQHDKKTNVAIISLLNGFMRRVLGYSYNVVIYTMNMKLRGNNYFCLFTRKFQTELV